MLGLTGIHSFVTDASQERNHPRKYLEHVLLTQLLSAWHWKKINGPIHLYTTPADAEFLKEMRMLEIYDYVDTEVLAEKDDIPWDHFGPVCKMKVASAQKKLPFAMIDNDLIFRVPLTQNDLNSDLTILHREVFLHRNYPPLDFLGKREGYDFPDFLEKKVDPINVGFLIWTNPQLLRDYWSYAYEYMRDNRGESQEPEWAVKGLPRFWKSLFVEQRLLAALVERDNYQVATLFPLKYSGDVKVWLDKDGLVKDFDQVQKELKVDFYHMWGEKSLYYLLEPPFCGSSQIRTLYTLIQTVNATGDPVLLDALDEIILFTIEKTHSLGLEDLYQLRTAAKYLLK